VFPSIKLEPLTGRTVAPSIANVTALLANPLPTTVTVVPTEAEDGLTTVTDGEIVVNGAVLNDPPTNATLCMPDAVAGTVKVAVVATGHACAATKPVAVAAVVPKTTPVGVVPEPKYLIGIPVWPAAPVATGTATMSPDDTTLKVVVTVLVPSLIDIQY